MCGVTGAIIKSDNHKYWDLLIASEIRGQDGTGIMVKGKNRSTITQKSNLKASDIEWELKLQKGDLVIGQNRLAIFGLTPENNQPVTTERLGLVHNGNLRDFEEVFVKHNLKRQYQVDSELILRLYERFAQDDWNVQGQEITRFKERIKGNWACLILDTWRNQIIAFAHYKPLFRYEDDTGIYFFSTEQIGKKVFGDHKFTPITNPILETG